MEELLRAEKVDRIQVRDALVTVKVRIREETLNPQDPQSESEALTSGLQHHR